MAPTGLPMHPRSGCLCKLPATRLEHLLETAYTAVFGSQAKHPMLAPEDSIALSVKHDVVLATTDFGPLVGPNLADAGRIAALHALSDIYACGGIPLHALGLLILGENDLHIQPEFAEDLLTSVLQTCREEGVDLRSGHTVVGCETMIGLTVIGIPRGNVSLNKRGAKAGDRLLLSKPLGLGIMVKARQLGLVGNDVFEEALHYMTTSNKDASVLAFRAEAHAATDVSGYGFLGHLTEMLSPSLGAKLYLRQIPILQTISKVPEATGFALVENNMKYVRCRVRLSGVHTSACFYSLASPETNGGLLVAVDEAAVPVLVRGGFCEIGEITAASQTIEIVDY